MISENLDIPMTAGEIGKELTIDCIEVKQPIGVFYTASIPFEELIAISRVDTRRIEQESSHRNGFETLLGIQRELSPKREKELHQYVNTYDACFPTAIILSVPQRCAEYDEVNKTLTLRAFTDEGDPENDVPYGAIANVLDGQHRIAGLKGFRASDRSFDINVSIFLELDPASEAYIFSVVNQAQTKVNKSLVYDLYSLATARSPQKLCHQIAVTLNQEVDSPFHSKIKRLGSASPMSKKVSITQAAFVDALMKHISTPHALSVDDRDRYMRGKKPVISDEKQKLKMIFREFMIAERDVELTAIIWNYFEAVKERWPQAWDDESQGSMLSKTNGFMALMRFLRDIYIQKSRVGEVITQKEFSQIFSGIDIDDAAFNVDNYKPGTSGESALYKDLKDKSGIAA